MDSLCAVLPKDSATTYSRRLPISSCATAGRAPLSIDAPPKLWPFNSRDSGGGVNIKRLKLTFIMTCLFSVSLASITVWIATQHNTQEQFCTYVAFTHTSPGYDHDPPDMKREVFIKQDGQYIPYDASKHRNVERYYIQVWDRDIRQGNWLSNGNPCKLVWDQFFGLWGAIWLFSMIICFLPIWGLLALSSLTIHLIKYFIGRPYG